MGKQAIINEVCYDIEENDSILYDPNNGGIKFPIEQTPLCMKCERIMDFFHVIDKIYDRYTCTCREDRWVLNLFTPRNKEVHKEAESYEPLVFIPDKPLDVIVLMEEITNEVRNEILTADELRIFLRQLTAAEKIFNYFVQCFGLYNSEADVRSIMLEIHHKALKLPFYNKANDHQIANAERLRNDYPAAITVHKRNPLPDPERAANFITSIFSSLS